MSHRQDLQDLHQRIGQPVIILGVDRSGTSLLANLVHRWGAYGGDVAQLLWSNQNNPRGHFENWTMQAFLSDNFGIDFYHPGYEERLGQKALDPEVREGALRLMEGMAQQNRVWFWKEPYLSTSLSFWKEVWGDAIYIIPVRHPYETALSLDKFLLPPKAEPRLRLVAASLLRWQRFMLCVLAGTDGSRNRIFIAYDRLLHAAEAECERLCAFLDERCGTEGRPPDRLRRMVEAVDPDLYRNRATMSLAEVSEATPEQRCLYQLLLRMVDDSATEFEASRYPLYAGWREYLENVHKILSYYDKAQPMLEHPVVRTSSAALRWKRRLSRKLRGRVRSLIRTLKRGRTRADAAV